MKKLKRIILMILMFAISGGSVNCSFRMKIDKRNSRLSLERSNYPERSGVSVMLSKISRTAMLMFNRFVPKFMELNIPLKQPDIGDRLSKYSTRLSLDSRRGMLELNREFLEFCKLTQEDSDNVGSILSFMHENYSEFSDCFIDFIEIYFGRRDDDVVFADMNKINRYLTGDVTFNHLKEIYSDSILSNIKFIRDIFEQKIVLDITFKVNSELDIQIPLSVLLKFDIFEGLWDWCIRDHCFCFPTDVFLSKEIQLLFEAVAEGRLEDIEELETGNVCDYLQINFDFIIECFFRDIENQDLESIEKFVEFVVQNFEEDRATEIFYRCLRILNPEHCDTIIERLSNIEKSIIALNSLSLTTIQLAFLLPRLGQFINLQIFNLDDNQLTELPVDIVQFTNLIRLGLSNNKLIKLPEGIRNLVHLSSFDISCNKFEEFPVEIKELRGLLHFYIDCNQLEKFAVKIGQLRSLFSIYIDCNQRTKFPKSICNFVWLHQICILNGNQLRELPVEINYLTNLRFLDLRSTSIEGFNNYYEGRQAVQGFMNSYFNR